jgi:arginine/lysine/histidine/glutamine transport system substrate-binding and permease protein
MGKRRIENGATEKRRTASIGSLFLRYSVFKCSLLLIAAALLAAPLAAQDDKGELRLAMSGAFQPFSTTDARGELVGFDADIATVLAERMGYTPRLIQNDWAAIQAGLQTERYELICGSMAITDERLQTMHFTLPYYVSGAQVFAPAGTQSLQGLRIGVTEDSTYAEYIENNPDQFPGASIIQYGSEAEIVAAINANRVDAFVSDLIVGGFYIEQGGAGNIQPFGELLYQEACGIAARLDSAELVLEANAALFAIIQDGTYARIYRDWVGIDPDIQTLLASWADYAAHIPGERLADIQRETAFATSLQRMLPLLAKGAQITLLLSVLTAVIAFFTGTLIGVGSVSVNRTLEALSRGYIAVVRGTPLLVQLFIAYYGGGYLMQVLFDRELVGAFGAAMVALVINMTAYNAETVRGGIQSVERGQWEAAYSLGMSRARALRRVILPQAYRNSLASLGNNLVVLIKDTSLVGAITLIELTYSARNVMFQTGQPFLPFLAAGLMYLAIITLLTFGVRRWEIRLMKPMGGKVA